MSQEQIQKLEKDLKHQEAVASKTYQKLRNVRKSVKINISDHALVRFLERVHGIDMNSIRESILTPQLVKLCQTFGNGEFPIRDDSVRAVVQNGTIVTILT